MVFNQLACPDCNMKYIRQNGRPFHIRFKVHFCDFKYENGKPNLHNTYYRTFYWSYIKEILQITRKTRMMNTFQRFYIYNEKMLDNQIYEKCTVKLNVIFEAINQNNTNTEHSPL